jgi:flagellar basal-body rod modification protein FlgD
MTTVPGVGSATTPQDTSKATSSVGDLDYNAFLKLLIAQLKNQDPTNPTDSTQFVAQLATFSQVEQSISTNSKLDSMLTAQSLTLADNYIGRTITTSDGEISGVVSSVTIYSDGTVATLDDGSKVLLGPGLSVK